MCEQCDAGMEPTNTPTQSTFDGDTVKVCTGCGDALTYKYERYNGTLCRVCRADTEDEVTCDGCDETYLEGDVYEQSMYFDPWQVEEQSTGIRYCQSCIDRGSDRDEGIFYCEECNRDISDSNGRMYYYRILNECEQVCLRCIETDLKAGGVAALNDEDLLDKIFAGESLFGMFFNVGELEAEGWVPVEPFNDVRVTSGKDIGPACRKLFDAEQPFIIGYERMSIMGDEGYVTLFTKPSKV